MTSVMCPRQSSSTIEDGELSIFYISGKIILLQKPTVQESHVNNKLCEIIIMGITADKR